MIIKEIETKNVITKSNLPVCDFSVNPYTGCTHACKYCYASFMKRFSNHPEPWGEFIDVKIWDKIKNPRKYAGKELFIGSVTDPYNPQEELYGRTRVLLTELQGSGAKLSIATKSDLILRDLDLIKTFPDARVSWSVNTLDEAFKDDMDKAVSIERRLATMEEFHKAGVRTTCFISPIFPGITDVKAIIERAKNQCNFIWLENLNLRGNYKAVIMDYIKEKYPALLPLYQGIYHRGSRSYWEALDTELKEYAAEIGLDYVTNDDSISRPFNAPPVIVNYFYHSKIKNQHERAQCVRWTHVLQPPERSVEVIIMPELPEIETIKSVVEPQIHGLTIENVLVNRPEVIAHPTAEEFCKEVTGQTIFSMVRRGKFLTIHLKNESRIILHLRMTGCLLVTPPDYPKEKHTHIVMQLNNRMELRFSDTRRFGRFWLIRNDEKDTYSGISKLGLEPLSAECDAKYLQSRFEKRKKTIKECLLDQSVVAGIGNIYSDEILFRAKICPTRPAGSLTSEEWKRFAEMIPECLLYFTTKNHITTEEYLKTKGQDYRNTSFLQVYGHADEPCPNCGKTLVRTVIGGRSSVYCPNCQKG